MGKLSYREVWASSGMLGVRWQTKVVISEQPDPRRNPSVFWNNVCLSVQPSKLWLSKEGPVSAYSLTIPLEQASGSLSIWDNPTASYPALHQPTLRNLHILCQIH